jgi:signal transduction histidine kinase
MFYKARLFGRGCRAGVMLTLLRAGLALWALVLGATVWAGQGASEPRDYVIGRAWLEDASGQLGLQDVRQLSAKPVSGVLSAGFGHSVIWLRLRIDPRAHPPGKLIPDRLVLRIRPVYLDDIQVFDTALADPRVGVLGDRHHPRQGEFDSLDFALTITRGEAPRDIWLRLQSTSTRQIHAQVFDLDDWDQAGRLQQLLFSSYAALILILAIWGLTTWFVGREPLLGAFGLKQTMALGFALTSLGYLRVLWPASWPAAWLDQLASFLSVVSVSTALLFHILFTREYGVRAWATTLQVILLAVQPFKLALLALGYTSLALQINMSEVLLVPAFLLISLVTAKGWAAPARRPMLPRWLVVGFYALFLVVLLVPALPGLALTTGGEISLYFVQIHGLLTATLILVLLQYRGRLKSREQHETDLALERSRLQALQEREVRQEQERLLEMLTHELKTPLATMNLRLDADAAGAQDLRRAIRDMSEVINRCVQASQLDDKKLRPLLRVCALADVVTDAVASCSEPQRIVTSIQGRGSALTDPQLLFLVLSNLIDNACKYAEPATPIELTLEQIPASRDAAGSVVLSLQNRPGQAGWPDPDRLFEKYYRSPRARRHSGTGLGLYLVRHLVHLLGGSIGYESDSQHVRFVIRLPVQPVDAVSA